MASVHVSQQMTGKKEALGPKRDSVRRRANHHDRMTCFKQNEMFFQPYCAA
jgi:hypothetical protein